ncbi:MAG TPA: MlaD family protein [Solirubrobacteraceae bacterium]|jgi:phospholipid/cholesterol/gamma-HCH transport system substrate-binding protein|nr:MlaD family protein [Solirubrobacteraceae bacterium]
MQKRAPTLANILVIVLFALSCFGLLLFLWESFGGPVPLKPKGYRFTVAFPRTLALAEQSDVRISGVNVGHVISLAYDKDGRAHVTIELASKYAPIPSNMHAILRQKTLLGETYVQLKPQGPGAPTLADGEQLPNAQVEPAVTLDDILATLTPETRRAFQVWMQSLAEGLGGRGEEINSSFATLQPFVEDANKLTAVAASQEGALTASIHNTGAVFDALTAREGQFRSLISNGERASHALAESSQAFAEAFRELPAFERNSQTALRALDVFATNTVPLLDQIRPFEEGLTPLLEAVKPFTPPFDALLTSLGPLTKAAKTGLPSVKKELDLTVPLFAATSPVLHNFNPFFQYLSEYVPELQALFANGTAATQTHEKNKNIPAGPQQHFLKAMQVLTPEGLSTYQQRIGTNRANAYPQPGAFNSIGSGLSVFSSAPCANSAPSLGGPESGTLTEEILEQLIGLEPGSRKKGAPVENHALYPPVANNPEKPGNVIPAPACKQQGPFTFNGQTSQFPHATPSK